MGWQQRESLPVGKQRDLGAQSVALRVGSLTIGLPETHAGLAGTGWGQGAPLPLLLTPLRRPLRFPSDNWAGWGERVIAQK